MKGCRARQNIEGGLTVRRGGGWGRGSLDLLGESGNIWVGTSWEGSVRGDPSGNELKETAESRRSFGGPTVHRWLGRDKWGVVKAVRRGKWER